MADTTPPPARRYDLGLVGLAAVLIVTAALKIGLAFFNPLWIDEYWTAVIIRLPTSAFLSYLPHDPAPPLSFLVWRVWAALFGTSEWALRAPSILFGLIGPLVALWPGSGLDRRTRLTWCALLACWVPGIWYAHIARYYTLEILLSTAQVVAFIRLARGNRRIDAWAWTVASALALLTHWGAAAVTIPQAIALLIIGRGRVLRHWSTLAAFAPPAAALALQLPTLVAFTTPGRTWVPKLNLFGATQIFDLVAGTPLTWLAIGLWLAVIGILWLTRGRRRAATVAGVAAAAAACSILAVGVGLAAGAIRPLVVARYFMPAGPGVLLGLVLIAEAASAWWRSAGVAIVGAFIAIALLFSVAPPRAQRLMFSDTFGRDLSFDAAARDAVAAGVRHVVLLQSGDPPATSLPVLREVNDDWGAFAYRVDGGAVDAKVLWVRAPSGPTPVVATAVARPHTAVLWYIQLSAPRPDLSSYPPGLPAGWTCKTYNPAPGLIVGCLRPTP